MTAQGSGRAGWATTPGAWAERVGQLWRYAVLVLLLSLTPKAGLAQTTSSPSTTAAITFSKLIVRLDNAPEIMLAEDGYRVHILEYLRSTGYNSVGAENLVFGKDNSDLADFALGGTVRELDCLTKPNQYPACSIGVEWQLLHMETDEVVYKVLTRYAEYNIRSLEDRDLGRRLILGAVHRLLLRDRFRTLLSAPPPPPSEDFPSASFAGCTDQAPALPQGAEQALKSTALVETNTGFASAVFLNREGYMLTAAHVAKHAPLTVHTSDKQKYSASVLRVSQRHDAALIQVSTGQSPACLPLADQSPPAGADVFVLGSPTGKELAFSVSKGIVSGLRVIDGTEAIQTDAAVNPGNSGGPMLDHQGRIVAIVSFKIAGRSIEGLSFGVPVQVALSSLGLSQADASSALLKTPVSALSSAPTSLVEDVTDDPTPLDLEAEQRRREAEERERLAAEKYAAAQKKREREEQLDAITPSYVKVLKYGGYVLAIGGASVAFVAYGQYNKDEATRDEYERARLMNDVGWGVAGLGLASIITAVILTPDLPDVEEPAAQRRRGVQLSVAPQGLGASLQVRY